MPLSYAHAGISDREIPAAVEPLLQHALDAYASETNKVASVWTEFRDADLTYRPHPRASAVGEILKLRLMERLVPSTYGPTADVQWKGADPTTTVAAAERKG